jgi:hypothetical protein
MKKVKLLVDATYGLAVESRRTVKAGTTGKVCRGGHIGSFVKVKWEDGQTCLVSIFSIEEAK